MDGYTTALDDVTRLIEQASQDASNRLEIRSGLGGKDVAHAIAYIAGEQNALRQLNEAVELLREGR